MTTFSHSRIFIHSENTIEDKLHDFNASNALVSVQTRWIMTSDTTPAVRTHVNKRGHVQETGAFRSLQWTPSLTWFVLTLSCTGAVLKHVANATRWKNRTQRKSEPPCAASRKRSFERRPETGCSFIKSSGVIYYMQRSAYCDAILEGAAHVCLRKPCFFQCEQPKPDALIMPSVLCAIAPVSLEVLSDAALSLYSSSCKLGNELSRAFWNSAHGCFFFFFFDKAPVSTFKFGDV